MNNGYLGLVSFAHCALGVLLDGPSFPGSIISRPAFYMLAFRISFILRRHLARCRGVRKRLKQ